MRLLSIFVAFPWLALLPALVFGVVGYRSRRAIAWVAAAVWLLYAAYETTMTLRILCSGGCNIRVDLLLIYPALLVLSVAAVLDAALAARRARRAR